MRMNDRFSTTAAASLLLLFAVLFGVPPVRAETYPLAPEARRDGFQVFVAFVDAVYEQDVTTVEKDNLRGGLIGSIPPCVWVWTAETPGGAGLMPGFEWSGEIRCVDDSVAYNPTGHIPRTREQRLHGWVTIAYSPAARITSMSVWSPKRVQTPGPIRTEDEAAREFLRYLAPLATAVGHTLTFAGTHCSAEDYPGPSDWRGWFQGPLSPPSDATPPYECSLDLDAQTGLLTWLHCDPLRP